MNNLKLLFRKFSNHIVKNKNLINSIKIIEIKNDLKYYINIVYKKIETYNKKTDSSKLRWINDCEVIFTTINPKSMADKKDVHLKILTTTDSTYTFEYSYIGEITKQKGIAYKVD